MISMNFTEEELVEIANHTAFSAFYAIENDDEEAWRIAKVAVSILDKIEAAYPGFIENEKLACAREILVIRRRVASHSKS